MMRSSIPLLGLALLALPVLACPDGADGGDESPPVQRGPQVGESRHDTSPPLRDIPPVPHPPGQRVHTVKPLPRPKPAPPPEADDKPAQ